MLTPLRTTVAAATVFAGLLAPAAAATADALPLTPMQQPVEPVAGTTGTGSVNTGPTGTGSFDPSPTGSSNLIKAFQTGSGQCNSGTMPFPVMDGSAAPWCGLYH
ncbi:hypothetical protein [Nocardia aurantiaca]|uniref:Uncharacterized protein n=1 Tax=Nocardia aurantiaca TaxID=2675850 RepID=A0A6I3L5Z3_9NOCA|nr:hypothetical protein [Nocardia aurantiaca]MTE17307.1 hypothetical protein [Nocardia aurantiaca]